MLSMGKSITHTLESHRMKTAGGGLRTARLISIITDWHRMSMAGGCARTEKSILITMDSP